STAVVADDLCEAPRETRSYTASTCVSQATSSEVMRSQSADDMCKIPSTRRRRFRQLLQTMIESGMYSAADCDNIDVSCSEAVMHNMGTFTRHINTTLTSVPYTEDVYKPSLSQGDLLKTRRQPTMNEAPLSHSNEMGKPLNAASSHSSIAIIHL
uniref:CARMIL_C domain-containing protein n=1 Tax=Ascaris lumbricoides TaxID=6252 RepID=A0A0M3IDS5_ASCLU